MQRKNLDDLRQRKPGNRTYQDQLLAEMQRETNYHRLRELREAAGFTQTALANQIGVRQNRVSKIELGALPRSRDETSLKCVEATRGDLVLSVKRPDGSRALLSLT